MQLLLLFFPLFSFFTCMLLSMFLGRDKGTPLVAVFSIFFSLIIALISGFDSVLNYSFLKVVPLYSWFGLGLFQSNIEFFNDSLSSVMCIMVLVVSFSVHLFALEYMGMDFQKERFMGLLSIFTFFMLLLVTADNFLQLLLGWEGVGICSYLLINFWYMRKNTNDSAFKALLFNRVGDLGLFLAMFLIYFYLKTFDFLIIFDNFMVLQQINFNFLIFKINVLDTVCCLLVFAAMAKSAQIFLNGWLMDAMEGPTPVSALIHAATMVTAGIYLIVRFSSLVSHSYIALFVIVLSGSLTTLLCSLIGMDSFDLKRIIASSTASQLGYMFFVCGLTEFSSSICHLFYHAFFKALLFLSAGVIIHSLLDEQDIRKMGGLVQKLPLGFAAISIGSFALIGAPFIGGFYSKDPIIEYSDLLVFVENLMTFFCCTLGAFNTTYYSTRLLNFVFLGNYKGSKMVFAKFHESSWVMYLPLVILMFFTFASYLSTDVLLGEANLFWLFEDEGLFFFREGEEDVDTFIVTVFFILAGILCFRNDNLFDMQIENFEYSTFSNFQEFFYFFKNSNFFKWFFDVVYVKFLTNLFYKFSNFLFINFDRGIFEFFGPLGFVRFFNRVSRLLVNFQTGFIYHYILFQIVNLLIFFMYLNNFMIESKLYVLFFLVIFALVRFFFYHTLVFSSLIIKQTKITNFARLPSSGVQKRYYGTGKKRRGRGKSGSDKPFDQRRNRHFKDPDAYGPRRPKMSTISQILFIGGQCFMNIFWLTTDLIRCLFRLFIGFPLFIGYHTLGFFVFKPFKYIGLGLFNFVIRIITWKIALLIFSFVYINSIFRAKRTTQEQLIAKRLEAKEHISSHNFIYSNRANAYIFRKTEDINKKFPQLHEIESTFFNFHSPTNSLNIRMFNFFHPFDFRTWFWRTSWEDSEFECYMPNSWVRKQKFFKPGLSSHFLGWSNQNVYGPNIDPAINTFYMRENWSRDWWHKNLSAGTNKPSAIFFPENYLGNVRSSALRHRRKWAKRNKDGFSMGATSKPVELNKVLRPPYSIAPKTILVKNSKPGMLANSRLKSDESVISNSESAINEKLISAEVASGAISTSFDDHINFQMVHPIYGNKIESLWNNVQRIDFSIADAEIIDSAIRDVKQIRDFFAQEQVEIYNQKLDSKIRELDDELSGIKLDQIGGQNIKNFKLPRILLTGRKLFNRALKKKMVTKKHRSVRELFVQANLRLRGKRKTRALLQKHNDIKEDLTLTSNRLNAVPFYNYILYPFNRKARYNKVGKGPSPIVQFPEFFFKVKMLKLVGRSLRVKELFLKRDIRNLRKKIDYLVANFANDLEVRYEVIAFERLEGYFNESTRQPLKEFAIKHLKDNKKAFEVQIRELYSMLVIKEASLKELQEEFLSGHALTKSAIAKAQVESHVAASEQLVEINPKGELKHDELVEPQDSSIQSESNKKEVGSKKVKASNLLQEYSRDQILDVKHPSRVRSYSAYPDNPTIVQNVRSLGRRQLFFDKLNKKFLQLKMRFFEFEVKKCGRGEYRCCERTNSIYWCWAGV